MHQLKVKKTLPQLTKIRYIFEKDCLYKRKLLISGLTNAKVPV